MEKKVGDRIFFEYCDGTIGTAIIQDMEEKTYTERKGRGIESEVKTFNYKRFYTDKQHSFIEDYECLPEDDPRVVEFCKGKKFHILTNIKDEFLKLLEAHGCHKGDPGVSEMLYELSNEFEVEQK